MSSSGFSATSGSKLFIRQRNAASCCQSSQEVDRHRGDRTVCTSVFIVESLTGESSDTLRSGVDQRPASYQSKSALDVVVEKAIRFSERNRLTDFGVRGFYSFPSFQRMNEVERLVSTHQLNSKNRLFVLHVFQKLNRANF